MRATQQRRMVYVAIKAPVTLLKHLEENANGRVSATDDHYQRSV
jgi:hypothetical protein